MFRANAAPTASGSTSSASPQASTGTGGGYYGTGGGYYGTGSGYYSSTSTYGNNYSSIDGPYTQSGTSSAYTGDLPTTSYISNTGSAYYAPTTPATQAQPKPTTASTQGTLAPAAAGGTFDLQYDTQTYPDGSSLKDDVGDGFTLTVGNPSKTIKFVTWTVPNADKGLNSDINSGSTELPLPSTFSNGPFVNPQTGQQQGIAGGYWNTKPGTNAVKVVVTFTDNSTATKTLNVTVVAPQFISFSRTYRPMGMTTVKDDTANFEGNPVAGLTQAVTNNFGGITTPGNQFAAQVDGTKLPETGFIYMEQTVVDDVKQTLNANTTDNGVTGNVYESTNSVQAKDSKGNVSYKLTPTVPFLDVVNNNLAYAGASAKVPAGAQSDIYMASDSPTVAIGGTSPEDYAAGGQARYVFDVKRSATFVSTLMFQSVGGMPVPVASMTWTVGGRATAKIPGPVNKGYYLSSSTWTVTGQTPATGGVQQGMATTAYPSWTGSKGTTYVTVLNQSVSPR